MNEEEKESIEEFRKQLILAINIDDVTTTIRNDNAQTILNLIEKLQKENEELNKENEHLHREINRRIKLKIENEKIVDTQFIYKQKIENKIEELNQYYKKEIYPILYQWSDITITEHYDEMIELLQELLGDK